jgi:hypothetical protein
MGAPWRDRGLPSIQYAIQYTIAVHSPTTKFTLTSLKSIGDQDGQLPRSHCTLVGEIERGHPAGVLKLEKSNRPTPLFGQGHS